MSDERVVSAIADALQALARADRILDRFGRLSDRAGGGEALRPWQAAQVSIARAMCLMIDSLEGVGDV